MQIFLKRVLCFLTISCILLPKPSLTIDDESNVLGEPYASRRGFLSNFKPLAEDIVQVTEAAPDIRREVHFYLEKELFPLIVSNFLLNDLWKSLWKDLLDPEYLLDKEKITASLSEPQLLDLEAFFREYEAIFSKITSFEESLTKILDQNPKWISITEKLSNLRDFYASYKAALVSALTAPGPSFEKFAYISSFLEPKALMVTESFFSYSFWRIPQSVARRISVINHLGQAAGSASDSGMHRVSFLPASSDKATSEEREQGRAKAKVYFKPDTYPALMPGMEALSYHLYQRIDNIPIPISTLLIIDNVLSGGRSNAFPYVIQASQAIKGKSAAALLTDPKEDMQQLDRELFLKQLLGALLSDPTDGKFDNFIYDEASRSLIPIDNDKVLRSPLNDRNPEIVNLKSLLFTLPLMSEVIREEFFNKFLIPFPEEVVHSFLESLDERNQSYACLVEHLSWNNSYRWGGLSQRIAAEDMQDLKVPYREAFSKRFRIPIILPFSHVEHLLKKLHGINDFFKRASRSATYQDLMNTVHPLMGLYYQKLRDKLSPYDATMAVFGWYESPDPAIRADHYSYWSSLLAPSDVLSDGTTVSEAVQQIQEAKYLSEDDYEDPNPEVLAQLKRPAELTLEIPYTSTLDDIAMGFISQWRSDIFQESTILNALDVLNQKRAQERYLQFKDERLALRWWKKGTPFFQNLGSTFSQLWQGTFENWANFNPELKWLMQLEKIFPHPWDHQDRYPQSIHEIRGVFLGDRCLPNDLKEVLFKPDGSFKSNPALGGRSEVTCYPLDRPFLHFKKYPEIPGYEYASGTFMRKLGVKDIPYVDVFLFYESETSVYPVLMSQSVKGSLVRDVWQDPSAFSHLDKDHISFLIVASILLNPEDDKEDNLILTEDGKKLIPIDKDHIFLPGVIVDSAKKYGRSMNVDPKLQSKSFVFCLDQMLTPLSEECIATILAIDPDLFLKEWMTDLVTIEERFVAILPSDSLLEVFRENGTIMRIPFDKHFIDNLHRKFYKLQSLLRDNKCQTGLNLLSALEPYVGKKYNEVFTSKFEKSPKDRFEKATKSLFSISDINGHRISVATSNSLMECVQISRSQLAGKAHEYHQGPAEALEWLCDLSDHQTHRHLRFVLSGEKDIERKIDCLSFSRDFEGQILSSFKTVMHPQDVVAVHNSRLLFSNYFKYPAFQMHAPFLLFLDLRGTQQGDASFFAVICDVCTNLQYLNISRWQKIKQIAAFKEGLLGLAVQEKPILEKLIRLVANDCPALEEVNVHLPQAECLEVNGSRKLRFLKLKGENLKTIHMKYCPFLTKFTLNSQTYSPQTKQTEPEDLETFDHRGKQLTFLDLGQLKWREGLKDTQTLVARVKLDNNSPTWHKKVVEALKTESKSLDLSDERIDASGFLMLSTILQGTSIENLNLARINLQLGEQDLSKKKHSELVNSLVPWQIYSRRAFKASDRGSGIRIHSTDMPNLIALDATGVLSQLIQMSFLTRKNHLSRLNRGEKPYALLCSMVLKSLEYFLNQSSLESLSTDSLGCMNAAYLDGGMPTYPGDLSFSLIGAIEPHAWWDSTMVMDCRFRLYLGFFEKIKHLRVTAPEKKDFAFISTCSSLASLDLSTLERGPLFTLNTGRLDELREIIEKTPVKDLNLSGWCIEEKDEKTNNIEQTIETIKKFLLLFENSKIKRLNLANFSIYFHPIYPVADQFELPDHQYDFAQALKKTFLPQKFLWVNIKNLEYNRRDLWNFSPSGPLSRAPFVRE